MRIFMAGGVSGNLKPLWKQTCQMMAEGKTFTEATEDSMRIFLAGGGVKALDAGRTPRISKKKRNADLSCRSNNDRESQTLLEGRCRYFLPESGLGDTWGYDRTVIEYHPYILESFFYADADTERLIPYFGDFLLDSGAFTFIQNKGVTQDWNDYVERYADFIIRNNVRKYFELDIDSVVGYERVKEFRKTLEKLTGRQSIPVWHPSRGTDEYKKLCDEYPYIAIGGVVIKEISRKQYNAFPSMISEAHRRGAKVHGLGFTCLSYLSKCHFDSVDSTAWTTGNRFGYVYYFDGKTMRKIDAPEGHRLKDSRAVALNNYTEWIKFQKYADKYL